MCDCKDFYYCPQNMPESKINGHGVRLLTSKFTVIPGGGGGGVGENKCERYKRKI